MASTAEKENLWLGEVCGLIRSYVDGGEFWEPLADLCIETAYSGCEPRDAVLDMLDFVTSEIQGLKDGLLALKKG